MAKIIFSVGFDFPSDQIEYIPFESDRSLLDADIIIFHPVLPKTLNIYNIFEGQPKLKDNDSFNAIKNSHHWRSELEAALDAGRTIIVYLSKYQEYSIQKANQLLSDAKNIIDTTYKPSIFHNYLCLPISLDRVVNNSGKEIRKAKDLKFLSLYWKEFAKYSTFKVYVKGDLDNVILTTKAGNRTIGAVISDQKGTMILLPPIDYENDEFSEIEAGTDEEVWSSKATTITHSLVSQLIEIDKSIRGYREATPTPEWAKHESYRSNKETILEKKIETATTQIDRLINNQSKLNYELEEEGKLRWLLYEKGHLLEEAILISLNLMGYSAESFRDTESEFDAVFNSVEGRFLGEAEGKDNSAVNIDKLSQLERNIQEDYSRDEVEEYAHGVLFGNAYRLQLPEERSDFFTEKCINGAKRSGIAMIRTPDLFDVGKYLKENSDSTFAKQCRDVILNTKGSVVQFPKVPIKKISMEGKNITEKCTD